MATFGDILGCRKLGGVLVKCSGHEPEICRGQDGADRLSGLSLPSLAALPSLGNPVLPRPMGQDMCMYIQCYQTGHFATFYSAIIISSAGS